MPDKRPRRPDLARYMALAQAGTEMVTPLVLGLVLDHYLGWMPWLTITGAVLGFVGGLSHMIIIANRLNRDEDGSRQGPEPS